MYLYIYIYIYLYIYIYKVSALCSPRRVRAVDLSGTSTLSRGSLPSTGFLGLGSTWFENPVFDLDLQSFGFAFVGGTELLCAGAPTTLQLIGTILALGIYCGIFSL